MGLYLYYNRHMRPAQSDGLITTCKITCYIVSNLIYHRMLHSVLQMSMQQQVCAPVALYNWPQVLSRPRAGAAAYGQDMPATQRPDALQPFVDHQVRAPCAYCRKKNKEVRSIALSNIQFSQHYYNPVHKALWIDCVPGL